MKKGRYFIVLLSIIAFFTSSSCLKDTDPEESRNQYVNKWMHDDVMGMYYYWNDKIPSKLNNKVDPESYFNSMLYSYNENLRPDGDRFSWIQDNYLELLDLLSGVSGNEPGFEYKLYIDFDDNIFGEFVYIKENTHAKTLGIKRGQVFTHVNNVKISWENYKTILSEAAKSPTLSLTIWDVTSDPHIVNKVYFSNEHTLTINLLNKYAENPIFLDTIYTVHGKTIGYLVYNFFSPDSGDESGSYDLALNNVIGKFNNHGVDNLILDLRYNSGGRVNSAIHLSSMIVRNLNTNNVFCQLEYNKEYNKLLLEKYGKDFLIDKFTDKVTIFGNDGKEKGKYDLNTIGNLQNLIFLTGSWTASASEMVINGLKPYMQLFLAGNVTIGKNVASSTFYKENDRRNKWGLQPIIAKYFNSEGKSDFTAGFTPDYFDHDSWNYPKKELGDLDEALLNAAIRHITGEPLSAPQTRSLQSAPALLQEIGASNDNKAWTNQIITHNVPRF